MTEFLLAMTAYLMGSIPFAWLLSRRRGLDLRRVGSGNIGATNLLRGAGARLATLAMLLDGLKGSAAVLMAETVGDGPALPVVAGCASIAGHVYPAWLRFRGGKGVATSAGAFAVLAPLATLVAAAVFVITVAVTRLVSLGSLAAAVTLVTVAVLDASPVVAAGASAAALLVFYRHRANLSRLVNGTERRLGRPGAHRAAP